ncbi:putative GDP-L-fucose synthase 2 [Nannochloris sp. 'desiccata']|nr:hypothetical protein KSW81_000672 [Chlorella desiccata (nom. nud.)]KAH7620677.1 putative GDP-L-fucose synthase 2 [Chlorella desiccata (nom. nud.)]
MNGHTEQALDRRGKVFVAGHRGLVGAAIHRNLLANGFSNIITRSRQELNLCNTQAVDSFFEEERIDYVFVAAAKVGGIKANNDYPTEFLLENLQIQNNIIPLAHKHGVKKLIFLGSSCIYPKEVEPQPIKETDLLTGPLEPTNEPYAIAKIAGIKLCQTLHKQYGFNAICAMPTNLYGPGDNFHPTGSHVLPALIRRTVEAKEENLPQVLNWGSGSPRREFLHVDDLAAACLHLMDTYSGNDIVNVGCGTDISIKELAEMVAEVIGYQGNIVWDKSQPDGTFRKLLDVSKLEKLGWKAGIELKQGIKETVDWYLNSKMNGQVRL